SSLKKCRETMEIILPGEIQQNAEYLRSLSPEDTKTLIRKFKQQQAPLVVYAGVLGERDFNNDEEDVLIFSVILAWYCISQKKPEMRMVTIAELERAEKEVETKVSEVENSSESMLHAEALEIVAKQSQPHLFGFLIETIMESENVREDTKGL